MARELDDDEITGLETPPPAGRIADPRQMAMEALDRSRLAEFNQETKSNLTFEQVYTDPDVDPGDVAAEIARQQLEAGEPHQIEGQDVESARQVATQTADEAPQTVKVKIDGQEREVPLSELVKKYQIDGAAEARLQEATRTLREATELAERLKNSTPATDSVHNQPESPAPAPTSPAALVKETVDALFAGDPEAATAKLAQIVSGTSSQTPVDIDAVAERVRERIQVDNALSEFRTRFPKLLDPEFAYLTDVRIAALQKEGKTLAEAIPLAGASLYDKFGFKAAEVPPPPSDGASRQERVARKAAASDMLPVRTISAGGNANPDYEPQSVSSILAEMRAARPGA